MKIKTVGKGAKVGTVTFEEDPTKQVKFWTSAPFAESLVIGAEGEAKFRTEPAQGQYPEQKFLKSWNGVEEKAAGRGGGGGGRPSKSPEEILAEQKNIHASVALQTAREFVCASSAGTYAPGDVTTAGKVFYDAMREWVK